MHHETFKIEEAICTAAFLKKTDDWGKYVLRLLYSSNQEQFTALEEAASAHLIEMGKSFEDMLWPINTFALGILREADELTGHTTAVEGDMTLKLSTKQKDVFDKDILIGDRIDVEVGLIPYHFLDRNGDEQKGVSLRLLSAKKSS